ncbi:MAG: hypothetical protein MUQ65_08930 [Armatimonadetes bacterium]|nr:hypothetical protein [Armatimonadota bacterium]
MSETDDRDFAPPNEAAEEAPDRGEYVFRFPIQPAAGEEAVYDDPLVELVRGQLADLLDTAILTDHGRRVRVDGFRLLQDPDTQYKVFPQGGTCEEEADESG